MSRGIFALGLAPLVAIGAYAMACGDGSHIFEGRRFLEPQGCLETNTGLDVVTGETSSQCGPTCLTKPLTDGGRALAVSTMCSPYPFGFDASGSDPACPEALAALVRNDTCLADGGSTSPLPPPTDAAPE